MLWNHDWYEFFFYYNSSCLQKVGVVKRLMSGAVVKKNSCQFARKSKTLAAHRVVSQTWNRTKIFLDPTGNALQYMNIGWISQNEHFARKYHKEGIVFFPKWANGLPGVIVAIPEYGQVHYIWTNASITTGMLSGWRPIMQNVDVFRCRSLNKLLKNILYADDLGYIDTLKRSFLWVSGSSKEMFRAVKRHALWHGWNERHFDTFAPKRI